MIAAPAPAAVAIGAAPSDTACMASIRSRSPERVDARCWRVGPLRIGMPRAKVEAVLGRPDATDTVIDDMKGGGVRPHAVYIFPRDLAQRLAHDPRPSLRFNALELTYREGRLVRIANGAPVRSSGPACVRAETGAEPPTRPDRAFLPYQRFLGMKVGDRLGDVRRKFGPSWSISDGDDFVNFLRIPLTLGVDEQPPTLRKRVDDFAIGVDGATVVEGGWVEVTVDRDPTTCLVRGFRLTGAGAKSGPV